MNENAIVIGFIVILFIGFIFGWNVKPESKRIESTKSITPELEITIKGNQIDTIYIYKKP